jgi:antitoxin MazE
VGNSLRCIPAAVARSLRFAPGQPVEVSIHDRTSRDCRGATAVDLAQKLVIDPERHGGEAMPTGRVGKEAF